MKRPIEDMLQHYEDSGMLRLHMPGHKGVQGEHDVTELSATDNLYSPGKAITSGCKHYLLSSAVRKKAICSQAERVLELLQ